jgi:hypothetical protein
MQETMRKRPSTRKSGERYEGESGSDGDWPSSMERLQLHPCCILLARTVVVCVIVILRTHSRQ